MFEGVGSIFKWFKNTSNKLLTATEVANANHIKLAMENDVDVLWIGARSTVSPFIVQEIADALKGTEDSIVEKPGKS